ncbi:plastocyanin/azurin family copper-binding protein [Rhodohalobacter halophilus]|uniref:plastocyanin/azurin family copper-binding protein n=1 Tax=Rhodohalobacter halophilus TaxID=1812810 RepID=UPI00083F6DB1|nr:plastocyanin/azurin family copper-binding protein [Rhodohalobacter halophilus]
MKKVLINSFLLLFVVAFAACGGGESAEQAQPEQEAAAQDDGIRTINVIGTDDLKFAVEGEQDGLVTGGTTGQYVILEAIEAEPGEEIRINLRTVSNMPPTAMSHNFVLVEMGTDVDAFARESLNARDNDYLSPNFEDQIIAATAMLGNGESDTITFTVPDEPGEYDFICTFPGHFAGGMVGKLIVQ